LHLRISRAHFDQVQTFEEFDFGADPGIPSQQVRDLANALAAIQPEDLRQRLDVKELDDRAIYPGHWQRNGYSADWVVDTYADMRAFITRAAERGLGLILYIN
jgi:hypothetical protein